MKNVILTERLHYYNYITITINHYKNLMPYIQTKNPTNVGLNVVERVNLFQQYHFLNIPVLSSLNGINIHTS